MTDAEKAQTPANEQGGAPDSGKAPDGNAALKAAEARAQAAEQAANAHRVNYENLHRAYGRQSTLVGKYRDLYGDLGSGSQSAERVEPSASNQDEGLPFTFTPEAADIAIVKFRQEVPDWNSREKADGPSLYEEALALIQDQSRNSEFLAFRHDPRTGKPILDFEASLKRAYKDAKLARIERAQANAAQAKAALDQRRNQMRAAGFISGEGANEAPEQLDFSKMTSDEILEKFPELGNPDDPPRVLRRRI